MPLGLLRAAARLRGRADPDREVVVPRGQEPGAAWGSLEPGLRWRWIAGGRARQGPEGPGGGRGITAAQGAVGLSTHGRT